jgi:hypothetical protein
MAVTTLTWSSAASGLYTAAANWTPAVAPTTTSQATLINASGTPYTISVGTPTGTQSFSTATVTLASPDATMQWVGTHTLNVFDVFLNAGTLAISTGRLAVLSAPTVTNGATLSVTGGSFAESGGTVTVSSLASFTGGSNTISGGIFNAGSLLIGDGITAGTFLVLNNGTLDATLGNAAATTISSAATLEADGTASNIKSPLSGAGDLKIGVGDTLTVAGSSVANTLHLDLAGIGSKLILGDTSVLAGFNAITRGLIDGGSATTPVNSIEISGVSSGVSAVYNSGSITLSGNAVGVITLDPTANYAPTTAAEVSFSGGSTDVFLFDSAVCFAEGTLITTQDGIVPVEALTLGDMIVTVDRIEQAAAPVKWIGRRRMPLRSPQGVLVAAELLPVRICKDAFGAGLPSRDLVVSPDHCLLIDDKLVPAKLLVNDMSIVLATDMHAVTYYHVELDRHAALLAEGLPAESYLDTGNRAFFSNATMALLLHPDFQINAALRCWERDACAPLAISEDLVLPIWQSLEARSRAQGKSTVQPFTTEDPDLMLHVAGRAHRPVTTEAGRYTFLLGEAGEAQLVSRSFSPGRLKPWLNDRRHLGVAIDRITVKSKTGHYDIPVDHPSLRDGWHAVERLQGAIWRWTAGRATLPLPPQAEGPLMVEISLRQAGTYVVSEETSMSAAA